MKWLQGVFATRYNRLRKERGALFQGSFQEYSVGGGSPGRAVLLHSSESGPGEDISSAMLREADLKD